VYWDCSEVCFKCYDESDKEIYEAQLHGESHRKIEEIVDEYLKMGWELPTD
jgi:hypothetical protein